MAEQQFFDFEAREREDAERQELLALTPIQIVDRALERKWINGYQLDSLWRSFDDGDRPGEKWGKNPRDWFTRMPEGMKEALVDTILVLREGEVQSVAVAENIAARRYRARHGVQEVSLADELRRSANSGSVHGSSMSSATPSAV